MNATVFSLNSLFFESLSGNTNTLVCCDLSYHPYLFSIFPFSPLPGPSFSLRRILSAGGFPVYNHHRPFLFLPQPPSPHELSPAVVTRHLFAIDSFLSHPSLLFQISPSPSCIGISVTLDDFGYPATSLFLFLFLRGIFCAVSPLSRSFLQPPLSGLREWEPESSPTLKVARHIPPPLFDLLGDGLARCNFFRAMLLEKVCPSLPRPLLFLCLVRPFVTTFPHFEPATVSPLPIPSHLPIRGRIYFSEPSDSS